MDDELWTFNGLDARSGDYLLAASPGDLVRAARGEPLDPRVLGELKARHQSALVGSFGVKEGVDVRDLGESGWGVIFPACEPGGAEARRQDAIVEALAPLLQLRHAQATRDHQNYYKEYRGKLGVQAGEGKQKWVARQGAGPGPVDPDKIPYYLLIVADPRAISFRFQSQLGVQYAVGRLWFSSLDEFASYAASVVAAETQRPTLARRLAFFAATNPDDAATAASTRHLVTPLADLFQRDRYVGWSVERIVGEAATRQALEGLLRGAPALLFTATHGAGFPCGDALQLAHQGALVCQDWPGPRAWRQPLPERFYLAGDHLAADLDLRGRIAFLFACYGAGTPELDEFSRQDGRGRGPIAPHPFVAALPSALLGRPRGGALAVIGHVERAWGHSFLWAGSGPGGRVGAQTAVFESALKSLLGGAPVGAAMEVFDERYAELASDLSVALEEVEHGGAVPEAELAGMWTANNDARGYAILGDPAVRLRVAPAAPARRSPREPSMDASASPPAADASSASAPRAADASATTAPRAAVTAPEPATPREEAEVLVEVEAEGEGTLRERVRQRVAAKLPPPPPPPQRGSAGSSRADESVQFGVVDRLLGREEAAAAPADGGSEAQGGVMDTLKGFVTKLGDTITGALGDMTSLEVRTYVASDMREFFVDEGEMHGAELRAYTRISLDGDTIVCVPERDGEVDKSVLEVHEKMVRQAQEARMELMRTIVQAAASLTGLRR